jgi:hypothetical protein
MRTKLVLILVVLSLALNISVVAAADSSSGAPAVKAPETSFHFGTVPQGTKVVHEFDLRNEGSADLLIQRVTASCGCTATTVSSRTIAPGSVEKLRMEFDTSGFSGSKTKTVEVVTNDANQPELVFSLKGVVEQGVSMEPTRLEFGELVPSSSASERRKQFTVQLKPGSDLSIASVKSYSSQISVSSLGNNAYVVELSPDLPRGELRDRVVVEFEGGKIQPVNVPITASVRRDLRLVPSTVSFGVVQGTAPIERRVKLENSSKKPITFNLLAPKDPAVTASLVEVEDGKRGVLVVKVDPTKVQGDLKALVEIETSHPSEGRLSLNVFGIQPPK